MVPSCFVVCKWAGADAGRQQPAANGSQDAKEKSLSLAGEAFKSSHYGHNEECVYLSAALCALSLQFRHWLFMYL